MYEAGFLRFLQPATYVNQYYHENMNNASFLQTKTKIKQKKEERRG
jgi:hypothetical protein